MLSKLRAQSIIEYALLAMLVIVGTIVMGPYVLRSINAHFKLWEESIDDSVNDRMVPGKGQVITGECHCGEFVKGECGAHKQRSNEKCAPNERYEYTPCTPAGCGFSKDFKEKCVPDNEGCCSTFSLCTQDPHNHDIGSCCGSIPLAPDDARCAPAARANPDPVTGLPPVQIPANKTDYASYCCYGEEALINSCGTEVRCMPVPKGSPYPDAGQCDAECTHIPSKAELCKGSDAGLTQDTKAQLLNSCLSPQPQTIELYVDDQAKVYASDSSGTKGALLLDTDPSNTCSTVHWKPNTNLSLIIPATPSTKNYILVETKNCGGASDNHYGISLKNVTTNKCLTEEITGWPWHADPFEPGAAATNCWYDFNYTDSNPTRSVLFSFTGPPAAEPTAANNFCRGDCSDLPNQKCLVQCKAGSTPSIVDGVMTCSSYETLGCSVTESKPGVYTIRNFQIHDCNTYASCETGEVMLGYCIRGTSNKKVAYECGHKQENPNIIHPPGCLASERTMSSVLLLEGTSCTSDWVNVDLYCAPCTCQGNRCNYPPSIPTWTPTCVYGNENNSDCESQPSYRGQATTAISCN